MAKGNWTYTPEQRAWIFHHYKDDCSTKVLCEQFSTLFPDHTINRSALQKFLSNNNLKKPRPKRIKIPSRNMIGVVIANKDGKKCRVKTENGYVQADTYFKELYGFPKNCRIVHLNGDYTDFSPENIVPISRGVHSALVFRHWFFDDPERTKAAILCAELIILLGASKNENQFLKISRR